MGERLGTLDALARAGVDPIAIDDGIALLDEVLCAGRLPVEVVAAGRFGLPPTVELERAERPLLRFVERTVLDYPGVELVAEAELGDGSDPYLADHVLDGVRLLPAVLGMEAMAQASSAVLGRPPNVLENVAFERAVTVPPGDVRRIRTAALRGRDGSATAVVRSDESGFRSDHFRATFRTEDVPAETVDGGGASEGEVPLRPEELYDTLLFHGPRFRRLRRYRVLSARRCVAEVDGRGDAWFGPFLPPRLLLGDPGLHDAVLHALQACVPGERVLPVGIERLAILRPPDGDGAFVVSGREREADGKVLVWDVDVAAPDGALVERWQGLRLQRVGATTAPERWPVPLLVPYLERRVAELTGRDLDLVLAQRAARASSDGAVASAAGTNGPVERRYDGRPEVEGRAVSAAHVDEFTLAVAGEGTVACDVERVVARAETMWQDLLGRNRFDLAAGIAGDLDEGLDTTATRLWAASECVQKAGSALGAPLTVATCSSDGWVLLRSGGAPIATYAGRVAGADRPLAFAFLARGGG
jgi:enediyne polyketide synthase